MKNKRFKTGSYNLKEKDENDETHPVNFGKFRFAFKKLGYEPELKEFVFEGWNGEKKRSISYRSGWNIDEHRVHLSELVSRFGTNLDNGLSENSVKINRETFGENVLRPPKKRSEWLKFLENVLLGLNLLLWVCGVLTIAAGIGQYITNDLDDAYGSFYSGASLLLVVVVAGSFSYYQEFKSNRVMESFKKMIPQYVTVIRGGQRSQIISTDIVVGDIIEINYGDKLPADCRVIDSQSLKVDNSSITGESDPQPRGSTYTDKDPMESKNLVFFSTSVVQGSAKCMVIKVGHATLIGRLAKLASSLLAAKTPIAKEMSRIIRLMTTISLFFGVIFYVIGLSMNYTWLSALFFVIGIVVANVPENLSVTLTIILALAAKKMAKKNCLVKQLHAVETLGSCTVICSDKTGTLTQNKMTVAHLFFNDKIVEADTLELSKEKRKYDIKDPGYLELANVAMLCSRARFKPGQEAVPILIMKAEGDSSEIAILRCMQLKLGNVENYRQRFPKIFEIPFNSVNKYQLSIHKYDTTDTGSGFLLVMKGAPEKIVDVCTSILVGEKEYKLDIVRKEKIKAAYLQLAALGERVLGFCDCQLRSEDYPENWIFDDTNFDISRNSLRFVGLMSLTDPPRSGVPNAILRCKAAGVKVAMITGDHPVTAAAIARAVNIISPGNKTAEELLQQGDLKAETSQTQAVAAVFTGTELSEMSNEKLQYYISIYDELIFARTSPEQKYEIVKAYQKLGHIVAVTGDGVNDAPALKRADIGIAIGSGTEVAKEVADLILLDDNFASIVGGIEDGRVIFDNLKKLVRFTMADNVAEMYCYWVYIILRVPLPMGTIAMLLSTLAADVFPAVSLAHESAESDIMKLKPRDPNTDKLMSGPMLSYSYGQIGIIETFGGFFAYFVTFAVNGWLMADLLFVQKQYESSSVNDLKDSYGQEWTYDNRMILEKQAQTAFFLAIVLTQFSNAICCKNRRVSIVQNGMKNKLMNFGLVLMIGVPCIFIYTPNLNTAVGFVPVRYESWLATLPFAVFLFIYDECRRFVVRLGLSPWISHEFGC